MLESGRQLRGCLAHFFRMRLDRLRGRRACTIKYGFSTTSGGSLSSALTRSRSHVFSKPLVVLFKRHLQVGNMGGLAHPMLPEPREFRSHR